MTMTENRPVTATDRIMSGTWHVAAKHVPDMVAAIRGLAVIADAKGNVVRGHDVIGFAVDPDGACQIATTDSYRLGTVSFPAGTMTGEDSYWGSVAMYVADLMAALKVAKPREHDTLSFTFAGTMPATVRYVSNGAETTTTVATRDLADHLTPGGIDRLFPARGFDGSPRFDVARFAGVTKAIGIACGASAKNEPTFDVVAMSERKPCHVRAFTVGGCPVNVLIMPVRQ